MKKLLRISPSAIDQFRVFYDEEYNGIVTEESLVDRITIPFVPSSAMALGTAFHSLLEKGEKILEQEGSKYFVRWTERSGFKMEAEFTQQEIDYILSERQFYQNGIMEKYTRHLRIEVAGYEIMIPMRYDYLEVDRIIDIKTTSRKPSYETYRKQLQWQIYLMSLPDAQQFEFRVYQIKRGKRAQYIKRHDFTFEREFMNEGRIYEMYEGFIAWLERKNLLEHYLEKELV